MTTCVLTLILFAVILPQLGQAEKPPYLIPQHATVQQIDEDSLQFTMELGGPPPIDPDPDHSITYHWFVDTDCNPETGQRHTTVGSEFNLRLVIRNHVDHGGGFLEDILGRRVLRLPVAVLGSKLLLRVRLDQLGNPRQFKYSSSAERWDGVNTHVEKAQSFSPAIAGGIDPAAPARVVLQPYLQLRDGVTSISPIVRTFDISGRPLSTRVMDIQCWGFPDVVLCENRAVAAQRGRVGRARVCVVVNGVLSINVAEVFTGVLETHPALMHLNLTNRPQGQVRIVARDAFDGVIPLGGHKITQRNDLGGIAMVSDDGLVTALASGVGKSGGISVFLDETKTVNYCDVHVIPSGIHLGPEREMRGRDVSFWIAPVIQPAGPHLSGFVRACEEASFATVLDTGYAYLAWTFGTQPPDLGQQFVGLKQTGGGGGSSGNPITCGMDAASDCCSLWCEANKSVPGLVFHEMTHMFADPLVSAHRILWNDRFHEPRDRAWGEAIANACGYLTTRHLLTPEVIARLPRGCCAHLANPRNHDSVGEIYRRWVTGKDPFAGVLMKLAHEHGFGMYARFFTIFYPPDEQIPFDPVTHDDRVTFFVAALSAAARTDLRAELRHNGLPCKDDLFERLLPMLTWRAAQRDDEVLRGMDNP